jgi:hypothetical protein
MNLMRNASPIRRGRKPKMTKEIIVRINEGMPSKRSGRTEYLSAWCNKLGVKPPAFYAARRRLFTGVR